MREIGRIERTVHNLDWIEDKGLRADTTDVLNKGEARHTLSRAVASISLAGFVIAATSVSYTEQRRSILSRHSFPAPGVWSECESRHPIRRSLNAASFIELAKLPRA